jgi:hypothetical protein
LRLQSKVGGRLHLRLNIGKRPIANKYREGKLKSTLKRELKVREIVVVEAIWLAKLKCYFLVSLVTFVLS